MLDFTQFDWLSFDCYGTLIDWEAGILGYIQPLLESKSRFATDEDVLRIYSEVEPRHQTGPYHSYREVLGNVVRDFGREFRFPVIPADAAALADTVRNWEPFPDTVPGLQRLKSRYKLAILSNIDNDMFMHTADKLQVPFDVVVTAQQLRSYKPARENFEALLKRTAAPAGRLLHVAESLYHDVAPAKALGITTVWVNRRQGKSAAASKLVPVRPDLEVRDLAGLASLAVPESGSASAS